MDGSPGKWLLIAGLAIAALGALLMLLPNGLGWFGRLPGDIELRGERTRLWLPLTSMIVVSLVLTVLLNLFRR